MFGWSVLTNPLEASADLEVDPHSESCAEESAHAGLTFSFGIGELLELIRPCIGEFFENGRK